jgi:hypothetical protein
VKISPADLTSAIIRSPAFSVVASLPLEAADRFEARVQVVQAVPNGRLSPP